MAFSKIHRTAEVEIPEGVNEDEVEIIGGVCHARGQWDEGVESVVLHAAKKADPKDEGQGKGKGEETKTNEPSGEVTSGPKIALTEPPKPKGRQGRQNDKPADKPAEASTETTPADKPAESSPETATDKPVEKS